MKSKLSIRIACISTWLVTLCSSVLLASDKTSFREHVAPILLDNCVACHGPKRAEGSYRIDSYAALAKTGDGGLAPIGNPNLESNELLRRMTTADHSERMPAESEPLVSDQIAIVRKWIAEGAAFDGENVADTLLKVIPPATYAPPAVSYPIPLPMTAVSFTPSGTQVVTGGYHEILVWNTADGSLARRISNVGQRVYALAWSSDGNTLAVGCGTPGKLGEVRLIHFESGELKNVIARTSDVVLDLAFRPNRNELAVASADSTIRLIDLSTMADRKLIASHADWVTALAWSDDGTKLASASRDKTAKVFDGETGDLVASYPGHAAAVRGITILPESKQVLSSGSDGKVHRWDVEGAKKVAELAVGGDAFRLIRGDGFVLVPSADKSLHRMDLSNNAESLTLKGHSDWVLCTALHAPTQRYVTGSVDGELRVWNAADGALLRSWVAKP